MEEDDKMSPSPKEDDKTANPATKGEAQDPEQTLEEIETVSNSLDSLNSALDFMEQKTDNIRAQLMALLQSNREMREELKDNQEPKNEEIKDHPME